MMIKASGSAAGIVSAPVYDDGAPDLRNFRAGAPSAIAIALARERAWREEHALERMVRHRRLKSFRDFVNATVGTMSALAPAAIGAAGLSIEEAMDRLGPAPDWLSRADIRPAKSARRVGGRAAIGARHFDQSSNLWVGDGPARIGDCIIHDGTVGDYLTLAVFGSSAEIRLRGAGFRIMTRAGKAQLFLRSPLPSTVAAACLGRPIDEVVEHPLLLGRGLVVEEVHGDEGWTTLVFQAGECGLPAFRGTGAGPISS